MRTWITTALVVVVLLSVAPARLLAADLSDFSARDSEDGKKVILTFRFSDIISADDEYYFDKNMVLLRVKDLKFSRRQLNKDILASTEHEPYYRRVIYSQQDTEGWIKLFLGKQINPSDALVVRLDTSIEVEILKPTWKTPQPEVKDPEPPADQPAGNGSGGTGFIPDEQPPVDDTGNGTEELPDNWEWNGGEEPDGAQPETNGTAEDGPVQDYTAPGLPAYSEFDLDDAPVAQVVLKGMPFREAIMELVASSGFNVVIGDDVDNTILTLDFRNREISLKRALDILCVAYDLDYTLDRDAIIFRAK